MVDTGRERHGPERSRVMLRLLRRLTVISLALAAAIVLVPRGLTHLALIGPGTEERLAAAGQAVEVARRYGAGTDLPAMAAAERELASAQALHAQGHDHQARHAAERALGLAADAQQAAIVRREAFRIRAKAVVDRLDKRIDELEDLYSQRSRGLSRQRSAEMLSQMKHARATAAVLVLAWEQQDYEAVLKDQEQALAVLDAVKAELQAAR